MGYIDKESAKWQEKLTCLALDLGGTKLLIGEIDDRGQVCRSKRYSSMIARNADQKSVIDSVILSIEDYMQTVGFGSEKIGIMSMGMVGRVDNAEGVWLEIDPSRAQALPVTKILSEHFGIPCVIDNDVHCAVNAEEVLGWGKKSRNYLYINVGTGIAAGIVANGKIITGASYNAGEIGHHVIYGDSDIVCTCGRKGCVEAIASGMGMDNRARTLISSYPESRLTIPENERCSIREIFKLADEGDPMCCRIADNAVDALANTIMNIVWVTDPDTVVLGGGVITDGWLLPRIRERLNPDAMRFVRNGLVMTEMNSDYIGLIGAGLKGIRHYRETKGITV